MDMNELGQPLGDGEGQGRLECYSPWGLKELDMTWQPNNNNHTTTTTNLVSLTMNLTVGQESSNCIAGQFSST